MTRPHSVLAAAIVHQAVKDWMEGDEDMKAECERFFASGWYQLLREISAEAIPEDMMRRLRK